MAFFFGGNRASVTLSGSVTTSPVLPTPGSGQAIVNIRATGTGADQTIRTVAAGKIFYLFAASSEDNTGGFTIKNGSTVVCYMRNSGGATPNPRIDSAVPIAAFAATETVVVNTTNAVAYNVWGVEVTL